MFIFFHLPYNWRCNSPYRYMNKDSMIYRIFMYIFASKNNLYFIIDISILDKSH